MSLTKPQAELLGEIREKGGLYVTRYKQFYRTVQALEKKGLVRVDEPDYSTLGMDHYVAVEEAGTQGLDEAIRAACLPNMRKAFAGEPITAGDIEDEQAALDVIRGRAGI